MTGPSSIAEYAEPLPYGRGIMRCDIVADGRLIASYVVGSPAPFVTVQRHERKVYLRRDKHE